MIDYVQDIRDSGITIYSMIVIFPDDGLFIPNDVLQNLLNRHLIGSSLDGYKPRTRKKILKSEICKVLGYPIPEKFSRKIKPDFPGQDFDVYAQKQLNVQIWNEEISLNRRYVFVRIGDEDTVTSVKVINGDNSQL